MHNAFKRSHLTSLIIFITLLSNQLFSVNTSFLSQKHKHCAYRILKQLGEGSFGSVFEIKSPLNPQSFALKKINLTTLAPNETYMLLTELQILAGHRSPYLVGFQGAFIEGSKLCLCMEKSDCGDLSHYLFFLSQQKKQLSDMTLHDMLCDLSAGLHYLHKHVKAIHRDLKPSNILMYNNLQLKIADFGASIVFASNDPNTYRSNTVIGSPLYMSPEALSAKVYSQKTDMWSLGCLLFEMLSLEAAFHAKSLSQLIKKVQRCQHRQMKRQQPEYLVALIPKLLDVNPNTRFSIHHLITYLKKVEENTTYCVSTLNHDPDQKDTFIDYRVQARTRMPLNKQTWESLLSKWNILLSPLTLEKEDSEQIKQYKVASKTSRRYDKRKRKPLSPQKNFRRKVSSFPILPPILPKQQPYSHAKKQ